MLQSIREGTQSTWVRVLVILIVLSFAGFGLEQVLFGGTGTSVAEVNGEEITPQQLQIAIDAQKRQMQQIFGDNLDPAMLEDDRLRPSALEGLVERELLLQEAQRQKLTASSRAIGRLVADVEAFKVDGRFDADRFKVVLANAGLTPERFRRSQSQDLILQQVQSSVADTEFTTPLELSAAASVLTEEREVRYLLINGETLVADLAVGDDEVRAYYDDNPEQFVSEAAVIAEYVELALDDFVAPVDPSLVDEQLAGVKADYTVADQARVSHILLIPSDEEDAAAFAQRIDDVAARLGAGEDFAAVAETASDDLGSASSGGELGFTDGSAFPDPMEAAIAVLEVGEISAPVQTDAGTHFIRVDERVAGEKPDDAVLRAELEASIQRSEAERELLAAVDTLRDLSFNAAGLAGPAKAIGAEVKRSGAITQSSGEGVFDSAQVRTALYAPEVLEAGNNSDVIELAGPRFVVARIAERIPPAPKAFEMVAGDIKARLESEALQQRLEQLLAEVTTRRTDGEGFDAIAEEGGYEWQVVLDAKRRGGRLPQEIAETAFTMAVTEAPDLELVALPGNQYALVELSRIRPGAVLNLSDAEAKALAQQVSQLQGEVSLLEFRSALRADATIVTR